MVGLGALQNTGKGIVVAGLCGGSGKSVVSVGITAAFSQDGRIVCPFKKGPDYIDAGWMQLAAGRPCYNLDPFLMDQDTIRKSFYCHSHDAELMIVEGNRGLFDGVDINGSYSTAELASIIKLPVLLVIDCTKSTRTVAALVLGCLQLDPDLLIAGCVLNRLGSSRHEKIVRESIEYYTDVKVVGAVRRQKKDIFPQRHIGITPCPEFAGAKAAVERLGTLIRENVDLGAVEEIMGKVDLSQLVKVDIPHSAESVRIGIIKDAAFQFYYPDNISELGSLGAEIIEIDALNEKNLPLLDGLYVGGGFPETSVKQLSENVSFRESLRVSIENGLPVYAECGGLIYLGEGMLVDNVFYPLTGVYPVTFRMTAKPQAHGYTVLRTDQPNPFYSSGTEIKGHEFRYSTIENWQGDSQKLAFSMKRGVGFVDGRDGLVCKNCLALYTHIHTLGTPEWGAGFMAKVREVKRQGRAT